MEEGRDYYLEEASGDKIVHRGSILEPRVWWRRGGEEKEREAGGFRMEGGRRRGLGAA